MTVFQTATAIPISEATRGIVTSEAAARSKLASTCLGPKEKRVEVLSQWLGSVDADEGER
jgi:hypothetical protein